MSFAVRLYNACTSAAALIVGPLFAVHGRGRKRLSERFGAWDLNVPEVVWFHGASLGEMNGLLPLMRRWKTRFPDVPILATAASTTGLDRAEGVAAFTRLMPFDSSLFVRRALGATRVRAFIFGETELWPVLLDELARREVPRYLVNARISERSFRNYRALSPLFGPLIRGLSCALSVSPADAARLCELGISPERCEAAGNAKYDIEAPSLRPEDRAAVRRTITHRAGPLMVLGSLRPGEEEWWFPALRRFVSADLTAVVAPRHPEKFSFFAEQLERSGIPFRRWSTPEAPARDSGLDVVLLDTLGELQRVYSAADAAFVGGSLVDWGGHNPLEPALCGVCVASGPHMSTVTEIVAALDDARARIELTDAASVEAFIERIAAGDPELSAAGERARAVAERFTGAAERIFARIEAQVSKSVRQGHGA